MLEEVKIFFCIDNKSLCINTFFPVTKRSARPEAQIKFGQFAGKGILELDIVNLDTVLDYEKENRVVRDIKN